MRNILPRQEICSLLDSEIDFKEYCLKDIDMIKDMKPGILFGLAAISWNRIIELGLHPVDQSALDECMRNKDPYAFKKISTIIGTPLIKDMYYAKGSIRTEGYASIDAVELFIANLFPNNLHIAEISFLHPDNVSHRKDSGGLVRNSRNHLYMFYRFIDKAVSWGKSKGCNYIMVNANSSLQADIFARCGFLMESPYAESRALNLGLGSPMVRQA